MSQENVDTVRRAIEAFNRREIWLDWADPDVEWIEDPRYPDSQTYWGHAGARRSIEKWWDTWAELTIRVEEIVDAGDQVVFWGATDALGHDSEVAVSAPSGGAWEFRGGLVVRVRVLGGPEAREAARLASARE